MSDDDIKLSVDEIRARNAAKRKTRPQSAGIREEVERELEANGYFMILGYSNDVNGPVFYLYSKRARGVIALSAGQIRKENIAALCPGLFLETLFPDMDSRASRSDAFREAVITLAYRKGVYNPANVRGLGAWMDAGRVVVNLGDRLAVDNSILDLEDIKSRYSYEARPTLPLDLSRPLTTDEGKAFQDLIHRLPWERNLSPYFLAGWCLTAQVCGALAWRPHIWLSGPAGSGKTWILTHIVKPAVGDLGLHVQFETSEAGLRQELMRDARPVLFDEAEGETERAANRMQNIMGLMRQASSENGARIIKGTAGGAAMSFAIRAQFAFASISPGLVQQADETRVTPLMVAKRHDPAGFAEIKRLHRELIAEDFAERLLARALVVLPRMADTVEIFSKAIGDRLGSQRIADQAGTLLAGAWLLQRDELPTTEQALAMVAAGDWGEEEITGEETDDRKLLRRLTQWEVRVDGESHTGHTITIGELILLAAGQGEHRDISPQSAGQVLRRFGFRVDGSGVAISARAEAIRDRLKGTPWYVGWHRALKSLPGASDFNKVVKFQAGSASQRSVTVPITALE